MSYEVETIVSASNVPLYVVDASVAVKWVLQDEPDTHLAERFLGDFREGRVGLVAPSHVRFEVPSAVRNAVRARRLTAFQGRVAIDNFLSWSVPTVDDDSLIEAGYERAVRTNCSLYDGCYVALAESIPTPLVYADLRLRNALGSTFPLGLWLDDYVPRG